MADYLFRQEAVQHGRPLPNKKGAYAIRMFEGSNLSALNDAVNIWLLALPDQSNLWAPHVVDTEMQFTMTKAPAGPNPPEFHYVVKVTIYVEGVSGAAPTI